MRYTLLSALTLYYTEFAPDAIALLQKSLSEKKPASKAEDIEDLQLC
jgi:hypothetical protein